MASIPAAATSTTSGNGNSYRGSFAIMTSLFFLWGFMTVFNDILIPRFQDAFQLSNFKALLVQFAFFGAVGHRLGGKLGRTNPRHEPHPLSPFLSRSGCRACAVLMGSLTRLSDCRRREFGPKVTGTGR
jgi:hypothetical protein